VELNINTLSGTASGTVELNDEVFAAEFKEPLIHQVVTAYLAAGRSGTSSQKNRAAVSGGGSKPWRQKGTGRARAGTIRSPIFRGGGNTFPAGTRSYEQKVNRKMYRGAIRSILSELLRAERMRVVDAIELPEPKTKLLVEQLKNAELKDVLMIVTGDSSNLELASRNLYRIEVIDAGDVNPVNLIQHQNVVVTADALKKIEEGLL
jgi:large subunit ribosomal protein L4